MCKRRKLPSAMPFYFSFGLSAFPLFATRRFCVTIEKSRLFGMRCTNGSSGRDKAGGLYSLCRSLSKRSHNNIPAIFFFGWSFFLCCTVLPRLGPIWRKLSLNRLFWLMNYTLSMRKVKVSHFGREHKLYSPTMKFTSRIKSLNASFQMEKW